MTENGCTVGEDLLKHIRLRIDRTTEQSAPGGSRSDECARQQRRQREDELSICCQAVRRLRINRGALIHLRAKPQLEMD